MTHAIALRPPMPNEWDEARAELVRARECILNDDFGDVARKFMVEKAGEEKANILGRADTSVNPLASVCRQLSTPGLYGRMPLVSHPDAAAADPLIGPRGQLSLAGWLTKMPLVQFLAIGLGEEFLRLDAAKGRLTVRTVSPCDVYMECDPDAPDEPMVIWERRYRCMAGKWLWCWDRYDVGLGGAEPSYRVVRPATEGSAEEDLSGYFLGVDGGLVGEAYPYRDFNGQPFLPWVVYRAIDSGRPWNQDQKRGLTLGTLNNVVYATYAGFAALGASGRSVLAVGIEPIGSSVQVAAADTSQTARVRTVQIMPGSMLFTQPTGQGQAFAQEIGPGADLVSLQGFCRDYELSQAVRSGINPADVQRTGGNPTSGSALAISDKGRREYADQVRPLFQRRDLEVLRKAAWLMDLGGLGRVPDEGYSIEYHSIPETPDERGALRDEIDWQVEKGLLSPIDAYQTLHPGTSPTQAEAAMVKAQLDKMRLAKQVADMAKQLGIASAEEKQALVGIIDIGRQLLIEPTLNEEAKRLALISLAGMSEDAAGALARASSVKPSTSGSSSAVALELEDDTEDQDTNEPADPAMEE